MRRDPTFWLALAVAFVLGLLPGLGVLAYQRQTTERLSADSAAELRSRQAAWETQKQQFEAQLASAEGTVSKLEAQVASLTVQGGGAKDTESTAAVTAASSGGRPTILARTVNGETAPGQKITLVVKVKGEADKVTMRLTRIRPDEGWVKTYDLEDTGASGGVHTWKSTVDCPSAKGDYRFFADAYLGDVHVSMPGSTLYMFTVE